MCKFARLHIGVLALQGDFERHIHQLKLIGTTATEIRLAIQLDNLDGLIIPGGESTTMDKLIDRFELRERLIQFGHHKPIWGTCAGMIMLSKSIENNISNVTPLGLIDIDVARTDYGRQVHSFEQTLSVSLNGVSVLMSATFIRAPRVVRVGDGVRVMAEYDQSPVLVAEGNHMASSFHSELENDTRLLEQFLKGVSERQVL